MTQYSIDLSNKECPNGHSGKLQVVGMDRELFEIRCGDCGWQGFDTSLMPRKKLNMILLCPKGHEVIFNGYGYDCETCMTEFDETEVTPKET